MVNFKNHKTICCLQEIHPIYKQKGLKAKESKIMYHYLQNNYQPQKSYCSYSNIKVNFKAKKHEENRRLFHKRLNLVRI